MTVGHKLASGAARIGKTKPVDNIIESCFEELEKCFPGHAALAQRVLEDAPELPLEKSILITQLLFFSERNRVLRLFAPGTSRAMHAGRIIFSL